MKKTILAACFLVLLLPSAVLAYGVKAGDSVYLAKGETIEGNLYAAGANLTIEGKVTGDVICAGQSININGQVAGDVICAGQSININGQIGGNLRLVGNSINFGGQAARNGMLLGATIVTSASSTIGWDVLALGNIFELRGDIGRDLHGYLGKANLAGKIGKNVNLNFGPKNGNAQPLAVAGTAEIGGDLNYTADQNANIENGAVIKGKTSHNFPAVIAKKPNFANLGWWWGNLIAVFAALVVGLVLISFWREPIIKTTDLMLARTGAAFGWGILALILTPPLAVILLFTIIGIPLSFILMALWLIALYASKVLTGVLIGRSLLNNFLPKKKDSLILGLIIGVAAAYLLFALPLIGRPLALLAMLWGLGGIMLMFRNNKKVN